MTANPNTFQNENIEVTYERKTGSIAKFHVHIKPKAALAAQEKAIRNISKEVSLPGFRKGKAPQSLVKQHYNKAIEQEFRDVQIQTAFYEAVQLTKVTPYDRNDMRLKIHKYLPSATEGTHIDFEFEAFPMVPAINLESLQIPRIDVPDVTPADVDDVIGNIRLQFAEWQKNTDRPAAEDDYVVFELHTPTGEKLSEASRYHLKDPSFPATLKQHLLGMKVGDFKDATPPESEENPWYDKPYRISLVGIEVPNLPPIDDELAKKTGVANIDELRKSIENQLTQRRKQNALDHQRHHMREFLLQNYAFDLPGKVIENVVGRTANIPHVGQNDGPDADMENYLINQARMAFIIHHVSHDNKIELSEEELRFGTMRLWLSHISQHGEDNSQETLKKIQESAPNTLLSHKVLDFLISKAQVTEPCDGHH